jgi:hypothetical protein
MIGLLAVLAFIALQVGGIALHGSVKARSFKAWWLS